MEINEKLKVSDGMSAWIKDFQESDAPQFKDKSEKERREMAIAAYMSAKKGGMNESLDLTKIIKTGRKLDRDNYKFDGLYVDKNNMSSLVSDLKRAGYSKSSEVAVKGTQRTNITFTANGKPDIHISYDGQSQDADVSYDRRVIESVDLDEASKYTLYHSTYTSAINTALAHHEKSGLSVDDEDRWNKVAVGPKKPSEGKSIKLDIPATNSKTGKKHMIHVQVYNRGGSTPFELNTYATTSRALQKEDVDLDEAFTDKEIKMAYGILNDPRYKSGNLTKAVNKIEQIKKGLSKHPGVQKAMKATTESLDEAVKKTEVKKVYSKKKNHIGTIYMIDNGKNKSFLSGVYHVNNTFDNQIQDAAKLEKWIQSQHERNLSSIMKDREEALRNLKKIEAEMKSIPESFDLDENLADWLNKAKRKIGKKIGLGWKLTPKEMAKRVRSMENDELVSLYTTYHGTKISKASMETDSAPIVYNLVKREIERRFPGLDPKKLGQLGFNFDESSRNINENNTKFTSADQWMAAALKAGKPVFMMSGKNIVALFDRNLRGEWQSAKGYGHLPTSILEETGLSEAFKSGDSVKIINAKKYDALSKPEVSGTVIGMNGNKVMVKIGRPGISSGQMNVDPKDLVKESVQMKSIEAIIQEAKGGSGPRSMFVKDSSDLQENKRPTYMELLKLAGYKDDPKGRRDQQLMYKMLDMPDDYPSAEVTKKFISLLDKYKYPKLNTGQTTDHSYNPRDNLPLYQYRIGPGKVAVTVNPRVNNTGLPGWFRSDSVQYKYKKEALIKEAKGGSGPRSMFVKDSGDDHIIMQLRSAQDLGGMKKIKFRGGKEGQVDKMDIDTVLKVHDMLSPEGKRKLRIMVSKSPADLVKAATELRKAMK